MQDIIESRVEKRTKGVYVPVGGKKLLTFMDDFNMPAKDVFGSQPPLELIKLWLDYGFWYDRQKQTIKFVRVGDCMMLNLILSIHGYSVRDCSKGLDLILSSRKLSSPSCNKLTLRNHIKFMPYLHIILSLIFYLVDIGFALLVLWFLFTLSCIFLKKLVLKFCKVTV